MLTTNRNRDILLNKEVTGWEIQKEEGGWVYYNFDGERSTETYKSKKECLGATGLDWE